MPDIIARNIHFLLLLFLCLFVLREEVLQTEAIYPQNLRPRISKKGFKVRCAFASLSGAHSEQVI